MDLTQPWWFAVNQLELSLLQFKKRFGSEGACQNALARWLQMPEVQTHQRLPQQDPPSFATYEMPSPSLTHVRRHFPSDPYPFAKMVLGDLHWLGKTQAVFWPCVCPSNWSLVTKRRRPCRTKSARRWRNGTVNTRFLDLLYWRACPTNPKPVVSGGLQTLRRQEIVDYRAILSLAFLMSPTPKGLSDRLWTTFFSVGRPEAAGAGARRIKHRCW